MGDCQRDATQGYYRKSLELKKETNKKKASLTQDIGAGLEKPS